MAEGAAEASGTKVLLKTSMGDVTLQLYEDMPITAGNFKKLVEKGFYDGTVFHRIIDGFMIQGGDQQGTGMGGESIYGKGFGIETSPKVLFDRAGLLAMANTGRPNSNGSQFFITLAPAPHLNGGYTIYGEVTSGMDVVSAIGKVKTDPNNNKPLTPVVMNKVYLKK